MPFSLKFVLLSCLLLALTACERSDYTTWRCESTDHSEKKSFVLDRAKLIIDNKEYSYCGSLGKMSYFDYQCLGHAGAESIKFTPETGQLMLNEKTFYCKVL